jgi:hypothetical protein
MLAAYLFAAAVFTITPVPGPSARCPLPYQTPMLVTQFFFGRDIKGRAPLTDGEWNAFVADTVARNFPDGFTVSDGEGEWRDPKTHRAVRERSKIVTVAAAEAPGLAQRIESVMDSYRARFRQTSVGVRTSTQCGGF